MELWIHSVSAAQAKSWTFSATNFHSVISPCCVTFCLSAQPLAVYDLLVSNPVPAITKRLLQLIETLYLPNVPANSLPK